MTHPTPALIARYADPGAALDESTMWSLELHLESCPACRALLAGGATGDTRALLDRVAAAVGDGITAGPAPARRRRLPAAVHRWTVWRLVPWLGMTVALLAIAFLLGVLLPGSPSLVALLAPVAPLPAVAAAWSRRQDPAWELITGTPAAGLPMLLRRTAAVLIVIVPVLALAGHGTGISLAVCLLPCLAFTATAVGAGAFIGVRRAATLLGAGWVAVVAAPAAFTSELPALLQPASVPGWALLTAVTAAFAATRAGTFRRLSGLN